MGLFACDECDTVENTATSRYWFRDNNADGKGDLNGRALCSACDPALGRWHGIFPRETYDPAVHHVRNR